MKEIQLKLSDPGIDREKVLTKKEEAKANFNVMIGMVAR
jgi:hypothetical protein